MSTLSLKKKEDPDFDSMKHIKLENEGKFEHFRWDGENLYIKSSISNGVYVKIKRLTFRKERHLAIAKLIGDE